MVRHVSLALSLVAIMATGCATAKYPRTLTAGTARTLKSIAIVDDIHTPTSLTVPGAGRAVGGVVGLLADAALADRTQNAFTTKVLANVDFQKFAKETLRKSFARATRDHEGWTLVAPNDIEKADAAFVLEVRSMGIDDTSQLTWPPSLTPVYCPEISVAATLIGNPPFEVIRTGREVSTLDPTNHPVLYRRVERISKRDKLAIHTSDEYSGNADIFKAAFQKAIDLAVTRIADSWDDR